MPVPESTSSSSKDTILNRLLPRQLDNEYSGSRVALGILGLLIAVRTLQSVMIIFNGPSTVQTADGVPLDTYPAAAAQTILALFALSSLSRLIISLICIVVMWRYRSAVPLMFVVLLLTYTGGQIVGRFIPIVRVGRPPGILVNVSLLGLTILGLVLSLWKRRAAKVS